MYYLVLVKLNGFEYHPLVWVYYPIHCPIRYSKYCSLIAVRSSRTSYRFRFVHLPVSAGEPIVAVSTLFVEAAKSLPRAVNWS